MKWNYLVTCNSWNAKSLTQTISNQVKILVPIDYLFSGYPMGPKTCPKVIYPLSCKTLYSVVLNLWATISLITHLHGLSRDH